MKKNIDGRYMAGLFDGEGCIHVADFKWRMENPTRIQQIYRLDMHITTTCEKLAKWLISKVGGRFYKVPMKGNWKDAFRWNLSGNKNRERFFKSILPHSVIKTEQIKLALEYLSLHNTVCPDKRAVLAQKMRVLNRRGKSVETNTLNAKKVKRESELQSNLESELSVTADS